MLPWLILPRNWIAPPDCPKGCGPLVAITGTLSDAPVFSVTSPVKVLLPVRMGEPLLTRAKLFSSAPGPPSTPAKVLLPPRVSTAAVALPFTTRFSVPLPEVVRPPSVWLLASSFNVPLVVPAPRVRTVPVGRRLTPASCSVPSCTAVAPL